MNDILALPRAYTSPTSSSFYPLASQAAVPTTTKTLERGRTAAERLPDRSEGVSKVSLGIYAKYSAIPAIRGLEGVSRPASTEIIDNSSGEIITFSENRKLVRYALQAVARRFMAKFRIGNCLRVRQKQKDIQVWRSVEHGSADYKGLQTCGSVWVCPVCAAKIAARRRVEIQSAMALHNAANGGVFLLTLTTPHQRTDKLSDLLAKQAKALKFFNSDRSVRDVFKKMGVIGQIRALEVTHGRLSESNNGWHPHYHFLLFGASGLDLTQFFDDLYIRWHACCVRAGLGAPSIAHGLKLDDGSKASAYVSKWGLEDEMTKGHTKKALNGETPFDFLRAYLEDPTDNQARILFQEFGETFKGKRQLHWSAGLKEYFKIGDFSDEELSVQIDDHSVLLGTITVEQWRDVLRVEGRGLLLVYAEAQGWEGVQQYLNSIVTKGENVQSRS